MFKYEGNFESDWPLLEEKFTFFHDTWYMWCATSIMAPN